MMRDNSSLAKSWQLGGLVLGALFMCVAGSLSASATPQAGSDIPPDATPQVQQISPNQAAPGAHVKVIIQGSNFSAGVYVSSVSAAIHVESSKRISPTQLEAQLSIGASAQPSTVSLLVSNPASQAAEAAFKIVAGEAPTAPPKENVEPSKPAPPPAPSAPAAPEAPPAGEAKPSVPTAPPAPAAPAAPSAPETPATPPAPAAPAAPSAPETPATPPAPAAPAAPSAPETPTTPPAPAAPAASIGPQVTTIEPAKVGAGSDMDLKITGKNFGQGAKVSFSNPGVRVMGVTSVSGTELTVHIKVARDAAPGVASLYVINSDDSEVEAPFEVTGKAPPTLPPQPSPATPSTPGTPTSPAATASTETQRYDAFHLGNPTEIFHVHGKVKGALVVSPATIEYQEDGKTLVSIAVNDIKEIKTSSIAPNTFHITTASGKTFHFAPGSLRPSDARNLVDTLRKVLPQ